MSAVHEAARSGDIQTVERLLEGGSTVDERDKGGMTPLHYAAFAGRCEVADFLMQRGVPVDIRDAEGGTPLYFASYSGKADMVRLLLDRGAWLDAANRGYYTPLLIACENGHLEVVQILLQNGAKVRYASETLVTPLKAAQTGGHNEIVSELQRYVTKAESGIEKTLNDWDAFFNYLFIQTPDVSATELVKFTCQMEENPSRAPIRDLIALLGTAVCHPDYFEEQPLSRCPPHLVPRLPDGVVEHGLEFLNKQLVCMRRLWRDAMIRESRSKLLLSPRDLCETIWASPDLPSSVTRSFRAAVAYAEAPLIGRIKEALGSRFWAIPDGDLRAELGELA